jgi:hypothetical protein
MFVLFRLECLRRLGGGVQNGDMKFSYLIITHSRRAAKST